MRCFDFIIHPLLLNSFKMVSGQEGECCSQFELKANLNCRQVSEPHTLHV